jgi:hypothetical protein
LSAGASVVVFAALSLIALRRGGSGLLVRFGGGGLLFLSAALAAIWFFIQQHAPLSRAVSNIFTPDQGRFDLWTAAVSQWQLQPWIGTGSGTYLFYGREFRTERMQMDPVDVHNDYLNLLCEYGVLGGALFLLCFAAHLRSGYRAFLRLGPRRIAAGALPLSDRLALDIGALCAVAAYVVHSAVDFNMHIPANALVMAFVVGILANPGVDPLRAREPRRAQLLPQLTVAAIALILLVQAVRLIPGEQRAEAARQALRDEEPARALSFAEEALQRERANPNIYFYQGRALLALAHDDEHASDRTALYGRALEAFETARRLAPLDETYPLELAYVYDQLGRFEEGEKMYALARERDPRSDAIAQLYAAHREEWENAKREPSVRPNE